MRSHALLSRGCVLSGPLSARVASPRWEKAGCRRGERTVAAELGPGRGQASVALGRPVGILVHAPGRLSTPASVKSERDGEPSPQTQSPQLSQASSHRRQGREEARARSPWLPSPASRPVVTRAILPASSLLVRSGQAVPLGSQRRRPGASPTSPARRGRMPSQRPRCQGAYTPQAHVKPCFRPK